MSNAGKKISENEDVASPPLLSPLDVFSPPTKKTTYLRDAQRSDCAADRIAAHTVPNAGCELAPIEQYATNMSKASFEIGNPTMLSIKSRNSASYSCSLMN